MTEFDSALTLEALERIKADIEANRMRLLMPRERALAHVNHLIALERAKEQRT